MSNKKAKGLGRGLSALFGDENKEAPKVSTDPKTESTAQKYVEIGSLERNDFQPRLNFDESKLAELAKSIKKNGIIQPIAVRPLKNSQNTYQIVAGERRWLAAQKAGLHRVPIVILDLDALY